MPKRNVCFYFYFFCVYYHIFLIKSQILNKRRHLQGQVLSSLTVRVFEFYGGAFWTKMQSNRPLHSIGSYPCSTGSYFHSIGSYLSSIGSYFHFIGSYLSSIRSYFNYFVACCITLVYSCGISHFNRTSVETAFHRIVTIVRS